MNAALAMQLQSRRPLTGTPWPATTVPTYGGRPVAQLQVVRIPDGFGGFQEATAVTRVKEIADDAQVWAIVKALQSCYMLGERAILYATPTTLTEAWLMLTPVGVIARHLAPEAAQTLISDPKKAALANFRKNNERIKDLRTRLYDAAKAGQLPDGTVYTWTKWRALAKLVADDMWAHVKYQLQANVFGNLFELIADMVITTVRIAERIVTGGIDIADKATKPGEWPWYIWAGIGVGGLVALNQATGTLSNVKRLVGG